MIQLNYYMHSNSKCDIATTSITNVETKFAIKIVRATKFILRKFLYNVVQYVLFIGLVIFLHLHQTEIWYSTAG